MMISVAGQKAYNGAEERVRGGLLLKKGDSMNGHLEHYKEMQGWQFKYLARSCRPTQNHELKTKENNEILLVR